MRTITEKSKVFGIGFPKTATTSLEVALSHLGYRVCRGHWANNHTYWLMALYRHGDYDEIARFARNWDAFADAPWGGSDLYVYLADKFPESKFICTIRDPEQWYESFVKNFTRHDSNRRTVFETFYKIGKHGAAYWFKWMFDIEDLVDNKQKILDVYTRRNDQILAFFEGRPGRLLTLDVTKNNGWGTLCEFLEKPEPEIPFPFLNKAPARSEGSISD